MNIVLHNIGNPQYENIKKRLIAHNINFTEDSPIVTDELKANRFFVKIPILTVNEKHLSVVEANKFLDDFLK